MTLSPVFPLKPGPPPRGSDRREEDIWRGEISATLKNISESRVHLIALTWSVEYSVEVLDSSGEPVPPTEHGRDVRAPRGPHNLYIGPVSPYDLEPAQENSVRMNLVGGRVGLSACRSKLFCADILWNRQSHSTTNGGREAEKSVSPTGY
jgi:hypothetical protein